MQRALDERNIGRIQVVLERIENDVSRVAYELGSADSNRHRLRFAAIVIAAAANMMLGAYHAFNTILEADAVWSLRLWMATQEWWLSLFATAVLASSLGLTVWVRAAGEDVDSSILLLTLELVLLIFGIVLQSWRTHRFRQLLYECWAGRSRTARPRAQEWLRDLHADLWRQYVRRAYRQLCVQSTESRLNPHNLVPRLRLHKIRHDVTEAMNCVTSGLGNQERERNPYDDTHIGERGYLQVYVYHTSTDMSVAWGGNDSYLFQKRVSRGILALRSIEVVSAIGLRVSDVDKWKIATDGILARNKGLQPWRLVCQIVKQPDIPTETSSALYPRPSKTLRGRIRNVMLEMYGELGDSFVEAATELNLLMRDVDMRHLNRWLRLESEHQDLRADWAVRRDAQNPKLNELLYLLQYVAMLVSLHFTHVLDCGRADEFVLLVAVKCLLEQELIDVGVSLADLHEACSDGATSLDRARAQSAALGPSAVRITTAYFGLWVDEEKAREWLQWITLLDGSGGWRGVIMTGVEE